MFGIGLPELLLIMGLGLVVLGPDKLPDLAKQLAKGMVELKRTANSLKHSLQEEMEDEDDDSPLLDDLSETAGQPWRGLDGKGGLPSDKLPKGFDEFGVINTASEDNGGVNPPVDDSAGEVAEADAPEQSENVDVAVEAVTTEDPEQKDNPVA